MALRAARRLTGPSAVLAVVLVCGAAAAARQFTITQSGSVSVGQPMGTTTPMARGTGIILGRAIEASGNRAVPGAIVTLTLQGSAPLRVMADGQGQFAFRDLPAGHFSIDATRAGFLDGAYGRLRPAGPGQSIDLAANQALSDVTIPLWKLAAITGRVVDENGEPIVNAAVRVLKRTTVAGGRQFVNGPAANTDDRGVYRIVSLEPGDYLIVVPMTKTPAADAMIMSLGLPVPPPSADGGRSAFVYRVADGGNQIVISGADAGAPSAGTAEDGHALTYQTEFYPGATTAGRATPITISSGDERAGIDFQLKPVRAVNVTGRVTQTAGQSGSVSVNLLPADADAFATPIETATAVTDSDGGFRFTGVAPGQYTLRVLRTPRAVAFGGETTTVQSANGSVMRMVVSRGGGPGVPAPPLPTEPTLWADMSVSVGANDLDDLAVPLRPGLRLNGRVEFTGATIPPAPEQLPAIGITLDPAEGRTEGLGGATRGRVEPGGQFTTMGVPPGRYLLRVNAPRGWTLRSAIINGQDISDTPIELRDGDASGVVITFTDRPSDLSGTVTSAGGQPDGSAAVIVFPVDRGAWTNTGANPRRLKNVRAARDGSYSIPNLPAGDYFAAAVPDATTSEWQSVEFLTALSRGATRMTIGEGEKKMQALTTMRGQ